MDKQHILNEIRRTAKDGKAIGQKLFFTETGIRVHEWHGKYWAKWSDALLEAGFGENEWQIAFEESEIFKNIIGLIRKLGKYPTKAEMQLERRENQHFPHPLRRLGGKKQLIKKLIEFCETEGSCDDVLIILRETPVAEDSQEPAEDEGFKPQLGYVYLLASARKYKIGY